MINPFSIEGKWMLVTGAASGMGRETAIVCSQMGAIVVAVDNNAAGLGDTMQQLEGTGHHSYCIDLRDESTWTDLLDSDVTIDGMANCAGIANMNPFSFISRPELDKVFEVNFFGPVLLTKSLIKKRKIRSGASIVFVSSVDGPRIVHMGNSAYSASKSALVGMCRNMAIDLAPKKIRVNCVLPGTTDTPLIRTNNVTEEDLEKNSKEFPLKRFGTPYDMACAIVYLLSEASSFVTGTELVVDGGYSLL